MATPSLAVLAANIKALRQTTGAPRTQAEIGKSAGIDQKTVGRTLAGTNAPSIDKLDGLARAFNVKPWQLLLPTLDPATAATDDSISTIVELASRLSPQDRRSVVALLSLIANRVVSLEDASDVLSQHIAPKR